MMRYSQMPAMASTPLCEQLPIARISSRPSLRRGQTGGSIDALAESIRCCGLLRPVIVRRTTPGRYVIVSGNRRLMACRMLGMMCIPVRVLRDDARWQPVDCLLDALLMGRMHYLEEAEALQVLHEVHRLPWPDLAEALVRGAEALEAQARLAVLTDEMKALLLEEGVPMAIALLLLRLPDDDSQMAMAERIARERLCVRDSALLIAATLRKQKDGVGNRENSMNGVTMREKMCGNQNAVEYWAKQQASGERKKIGIVRDVRLYLNAIRDITAQMQASGFRATVAERRVDGQTEFVIRVPVRRRRMERHQSM